MYELVWNGQRISRGVFYAEEIAKKFLKKTNWIKGPVFIRHTNDNPIPEYCSQCRWYDDSCQFEPVCILMDNTSRNPSWKDTPKDCPNKYF